MCGRYKSPSDKRRLAEIFHASAELEDLEALASDEAAPGSMQPVITAGTDGGLKLELMRWGFKLPKSLLFNARSEEVEESTFWGARFKEGRCIVPAETFYEWANVRRAPKPKYEFTVQGRELFGMAGIWSIWKNPMKQVWEETFAILTGDANGVMHPFHDRQPIIIEPREYEEYLAPSRRSAAHLLRVLADEDLRLRLVSRDDITQRQASLFDSQ